MIPETARLDLNSEQQAAVRCGQNAVVAAGAGSGKTMVLAHRFAWLVTEKKYRVREILTLTFTKKATAQMYRRIHLQLAEIAGDDPGEKGQLARKALEEFPQARIQTLDSYCAAIVKQACNRYGICPDFAIDENRCHQLALDEALPFLIANRSHPAMQRLYPGKSPMSIVNNIIAPALYGFTFIDSTPDPQKDLANQFIVIRNEWKKQSRVILEKLSDLSSAYQGNEKFHPDLAPLLNQYATGKINFPGEQELEEFFGKLLRLPHKQAIEWAESHALNRAMAKVLEFISSLAELDMRKGSPRNNPAKEILNEFRELFREFSSLIVYCIQAGLIYSVLMLLSDLQCRFLNKKKAGGILAFGDVARLARTILLEQHDIRRSEKESFRAIMIDEFQDNNQLQKDLLFLLAERPELSNDSIPPAADLSGGKLFFVGDEKQSIYRFRGADVSVFRQLKSELGSDELPLTANYRSAPELISAFNTVFGGCKYSLTETPQMNEYPAVFAPQAAGGLPLYEAAYTPLQAKNKDAGKLTLCILDKQDREDFAEDSALRLSATENEARYIAEKISGLLREKNESGEPKYRPDDIAILFHSRSPQHLFEKHLMLLNIPYASDELIGFFYGSPVNDLMSVLRLAAYPADRAAYAQMLRSPFAGLSLPGLAACIAAEDQISPSPFGDEPLSLLGDEDRAKYMHGRAIYNKIRDKACTESISSLVSELWYGEGYRYETEWNPKTAAYRELHDYLFHIAALADEDNQGLAAFTDNIQSLRKSGERLSDIEIPIERTGAVRLTTIHKSKGLEFPVVFICCCDKWGKNDFSGDIYNTGDAGLTFNPPLPPECDNIPNARRNYFWERSLAVEKGKKTAELRRLLYVGMTRAEKELYLSGCLGISKFLGLDKKDTAPAASEDFSMLLKQYIDKKIEKPARQDSIEGDTILAGNTFFGLCLPSFGAHIPGDGLASRPSFFAVEQIPVYGEQYILDAEQRGSRFPNNQKGLNDFFAMAEPYYENSETIQTPLVKRKHTSPTALSLEAGAEGALQGSFAVNGECSGLNSADVFGKVDSLLDRYAKQNGENSEKFSSAGFGTIAHICTEALLSGKEAIIPPKLAGFLSPADSDAFLEAGKELALRFSQSPLGIVAGESAYRKSEFPFRTLICGSEGNELFINGTIDLVFDDAKAFYVVDFKTDSEESPEIYIAQMACYYRAVSDMLAQPSGKKCKVFLYYLRSGHAVDITEQAGSYNELNFTGS